MDQTNQVNGAITNENKRDRVFLYEVLIQPAQTPSGASWQRRSAKISLKVPYNKMSQEMQRINRAGGKICRITPLSELEKNNILPTSPPWWVEISTQNPSCLYYFGPFDSLLEAKSYESGYVEDLQSENAQDIRVIIKQCQPQVLTQEK